MLSTLQCYYLVKFLLPEVTGQAWVEFVVGSRSLSKGFSPGSPVFLPPQKPTFLNSNSTWSARSPLKRAPGALWCSVDKQITFILHFTDHQLCPLSLMIDQYVICPHTTSHENQGNDHQT